MKSELSDHHNEVLRDLRSRPAGGFAPRPPGYLGKEEDVFEVGWSEDIGSIWCLRNRRGHVNAGLS